MVAQLATGLFGLALISWFARRAGLLAWRPGSPDAELTARMLRFARHGYWLGLLAFVVHDRVEVLLLGALTTSEAIGYYTAALGAAEAAMGIGPWVVASVFFPLLAGAWSPADPRAFRARYAQCARYLTFAAAPLALGGIALAEAGVAVFLGDAYAPMVPVLRVTLLATAFSALAQGPTAVLASVERQDWLLRVSGPLALANLLLDLALVPRYAALGAAWANLAVAIGEAILLSVVAWRLAGVLPPPGIGLPFVAAGLAAVAASWALGDRLDALGLILGALAAVPVYVAALVASRFFRKEDAEVVAPLVARLPIRLGHAHP
jgi:O-antigen/teichoic acid export membrane protein